MKKLASLLSAALLVVSSLSAFAKKQDLFNGKNLKGWEKRNGFAEFKVEDGVIVGVSTAKSPSTYLSTKKDYTNFVLEYEIMMDKDLNGGVQIRSHYDKSLGKNSVYGLQVEADDSSRGWTGGLYDQSRKGWRYTLEYNPEVKSAYRNHEWNKIKVVAVGNHIATWVNGVNVSNLFEEETETGFIALQVHAAGGAKIGRKTRWRNITIEEVDENYQFTTTAPIISYQLNSLTKEEKADGWKLLWDGKTTKGWRGAKLDAFPTSGWKIENNELVVLKSNGAESENGGDIVTTRPYKNFVLELDFMLTKGANSGIKYFVDTELNKDKGSAIGCEFQILDDNNHPDAKKGNAGNRTMGSLYDLIKASAREYIPSLYTNKYAAFQGWNRARIIVEGDHVRHYLNNCKVVDYKRGDQQWRSLVGYSKYKKWPNFGELEEGLILLQDHGDEVHFKNIKIKEL